MRILFVTDLSLQGGGLDHLSENILCRSPNRKAMQLCDSPHLTQACEHQSAPKVEFRESYTSHQIVLSTIDEPM